MSFFRSTFSAISPTLMNKRLSLTVLSSCMALALTNAVAQTVPAHPAPASGPAQHAGRSGANYHQYPQFSYPPSTASRRSPSRTAAPSAQRRHPSAAAAQSTSDLYSYDGWNPMSYDPPSLDTPSLSAPSVNAPWTAHGPADQPPGQSQ
ncbi:exported hypothetical protein [Paraburkholderia piptadeniae]|uniref:Uncharacterized protein n=1 Tax=Paraburkholderia piptadeniae TaxID=1701573 RepID=A0A1N7RN75_9BURK|nr:exported hypothetical protein [Paraburkholderia piptadeniae]